jgi:hypothetical protein
MPFRPNWIACAAFALLACLGFAASIRVHGQTKSRIVSGAPNLSHAG